MKILFLDVDGVLNSAHSRRALKTRRPLMYQPHFDELVRIVEETGCRIVLSSAWRHKTLALTLGVNSGFGVELRKMRNWGIVAQALYDVTGEDPQHRRGVEIVRWVAANAFVNGALQFNEYAVIDDETMSLVHPSKLFKTDFETGLTPEIADRVIAHLGAR